MFKKEKEQLAKSAKMLSEITPGTTGNLSLKAGKFFLTTPSGIRYNEIRPEDIPVVNFSCKKVEGRLNPTSDSIIHCKIYQNFASAKTIVHTHSAWATTLSVLKKPVPPFHYLVVLWGNCVPVADYATYGSVTLARNIVKTMKEHNTKACLMANHGIILYTTSCDLEQGVEQAEQLEQLCRVYCQAKPIGEPYLLSAKQLDKVRKKVAKYGNPNAHDC